MLTESGHVTECNVAAFLFQGRWFDGREQAVGGGSHVRQRPAHFAKGLLDDEFHEADAVSRADFGKVQAGA